MARRRNHEENVDTEFPEVKNRENVEFGVKVHGDRLVVETPAAINEVPVDADKVEEIQKAGVPDEGQLHDVASFSPAEAESINKARLARGETDLVAAEPDRLPKPSEDMQPGPAPFDINTANSLGEPVQDLKEGDKAVDQTQVVAEAANEVEEPDKDESAS